jgi:hypothetical protein
MSKIVVPYGDIFRAAHLNGECDFIYIMHSLVPTATAGHGRSFRKN